MAQPLVVEFPPETTEIIDELSKDLKLERVEILSRALGLLQLWNQARHQNRIFIERPAKGSGEEQEISVASPVTA